MKVLNSKSHVIKKKLTKIVIKRNRLVADTFLPLLPLGVKDKFMMLIEGKY